MIKFLSPVDGDVLFPGSDGMLTDNGFRATVALRANPGLDITVNNVKAEYRDGIYYADISADSYCNRVTAVCGDTGESVSMLVYRFADCTQTYCFGVDDVIFCFENIYRNADEYTSVFDDPFLAIYRDLHDRYGTKVHMHIYYETPDKKFNLSMFPDKYKPEFRANSDWLRFTFHSRCDIPDNPYQYAPYDLVYREGKQVINEIRRFAGDEVMDAFTSQHWANSALEGTRAFRDLGYRILDGYFTIDKHGNPFVSYYLNREQAMHAHSRDFWKDTKENIIFVRDDIVLNEVDCDKTEEYMEKLAKEKSHSLMYLLIHEQYFYKNYRRYEPDYRERIFKAVGWCERNGYRPVFLADAALEK